MSRRSSSTAQTASLRQTLVERPLAATGLGLALVAALWLSASEYLVLRLPANPSDPAADVMRVARLQPWGGLAGRQAATAVAQDWRIDPESSLEAMSWHLSRYPMTKRRWMDRVRMLTTLDPEPDRLRQELATALAVQPHHRELGWLRVNLAQQTGDTDLVIGQLRSWLQGQPNATGQALFVAGRWLPDPAERIDRVLPEGDAYLEAAMRYARSNQSAALAEAIWPRLSQPRPDGDRAMADYLHIMQRDGNEASVLALRQGLDPTYQPGDIPGGHFHGSTQWLTGMGWVLGMPEGVTLHLEQGDNADWPDHIASILRLDFAGTHNINLHSPRVQFALPHEGQWQLDGWWQADGLTTRSLPRLRLRALNQAQQQLVTVPSSSFDWQPFSTVLDIQEAGEPVELRLMRPSTQAFDRNIGGTLRLAALSLRPIESPDVEELPTP